MRKSGVAEKYVRVVQDMYKSCNTMARCAVGLTGVQGGDGTASRTSSEPLHVSVVMDRLIDEVRQESPWTMMFQMTL